MKKLCILTASRAEYGLLAVLIKKLLLEKEFDVRVVVTGMHLSPEFGLTWKEIEEDGVPIDRKIDMLLSADTPAAITKSMGVAMMGFADYFAETTPDALLVLGDRYETLAVCIAAMNARIPIFHIHGGETTEGNIDEAIRHSITKMSILHFASTEEYRKRIIQMGEQPETVFNVGALGVENALCEKLMDTKELEESLGIDLGSRYAVGTFHPVTLENATAGNQVKELLNAIEDNEQMKYLFTAANADQEGRVINSILNEYAMHHDNFFVVNSLGKKRYLSALKHAQFVIGNSSSGIIEAPAFGIPTINIGDRQKGRVAGASVIHCTPSKSDIDLAIKQAMSKEFHKKKLYTDHPYGNGGTSDKIANILKERFLNEEIEIKKSFYDIEL